MDFVPIFGFPSKTEPATCRCWGDSHFNERNHLRISTQMKKFSSANLQEKFSEIMSNYTLLSL